MGMDLELEWEEPGWQRMMDSLPRGSVIPAERFFAMLGAVDEEGALEAALTLTARGVGLDVSRLPQGGPGAAGERLAPVVMAACALVTTGPQACLEGAQYLAKMPDVRQNLGTLLEIFSDNEAAADLIRPEGGKITATLGSDLDPAMPGACIVSKRYLAGGGLTGSVALIGSTRMEYHRLLPILNYFATKLGQSMAGQGQ